MVNIRFIIILILLIMSMIFNAFAVDYTKKNPIEGFVSLYDRKTDDLKIDCSCNILEYSTKIIDKDYKDYERKIKKIIYNKSELNNIIKYLDGTVEWSRWLLVEDNDSILKEMNRDMYKSVEEKVKGHGIKILYSKLNRYKISLRDKNETLVDFDYVFYEPSEYYAYHVNIVCVINRKTMMRYFLYIEVVGKISEDKIHHHMCPEKNVYQEVVNTQKQFEYDTQMFDTHQSLIGEDDELRKLLYKKLTYNADINSVDYKKNVEYTENQGIVHNMFMSKLKKGEKNECNDKNIYKNYPYKSDIVIVNNEID